MSAPRLRFRFRQDRPITEAEHERRQAAVEAALRAPRPAGRQAEAAAISEASEAEPGTEPPIAVFVEVPGAVTAAELDDFRATWERITRLGRAARLPAEFAWHETPAGLRRWKAVFDHFSVERLPDGGREVFVLGMRLRMTAAEAAHIGRLLLPDPDDGI